MKKEAKSNVTPWEVSGDINYQKLIKQFGVSPLKGLPEVFEKNHLFKRKIVFAHRDIQRVLEAMHSKKPFVMMTGLVPTGKFHIGHIIIAQQMVFWQSLGAKVYIAVADLEAYNARGQSLEKSRKIAEDYISNYIALGLKPGNCEIYFQSQRSKEAKKSNAYYSLQNLLAKHATFNEFKAVYGSISPGKMLSALIQASDMLHPQLPEFSSKPLPIIVPVGIDQDPHIRLTRDISQRIKDPKLLQLSSTYNIFVPGLKGINSKMSASDPTSFISPADSPKEVETKIKKYAFSGGKDTLAEHREHGGNPDIDVSYQYLKILFEQDNKKLKKIHDDYKSGKLLTGELKSYTIEKMNSFFKEHQKKLRQAEKEIKKYLDN